MEVRAIFERMGRVGVHLADQASRVLLEREVALARVMETEDELMDDLHQGMFTALLSPDWSHGVEPAVDLSLLGRFYERFADHAVAVGTLRPDGSPHQTPVWFVFTAETWWVATAAANVKVRNVAADARVSLAVADPESPIVAEGSALIHPAPWPAEVLAAVAGKYGGWDVTDNRPEVNVSSSVSLSNAGYYLQRKRL